MTLTLLLYIVFPLLCMLAVPQTHRQGALAERVVLGAALYEFLLLATGGVLGLSHLLTPRLYGAVTWCTALSLGLPAWRNGLRLDPAPLSRWSRTRRGAAALLLAGSLALAFGLELAFDALRGTSHYDGLWYHIPRVLFWVQHGSFAPWDTPVWAQIGLPVAADVVLGQKILLGDGWRGTGYVSAVLSLGAVAAVYLAALELRFSRWQAVMAALLFGSFPAVGLRIWSVNSDITAAFPVLASYVALRRVRDGRLGLAFFLALNALALACKPTVAPHALLLGAVALWQCRGKLAELRLRGCALPCGALLLGATLLLGSYWPVYRAFSDWQGGTMGRGHKVASAAEVKEAIALTTGHWLLEPLGYLPLSARGWVKKQSKDAYNSLGAHLKELPEDWRPMPTQDDGRTGLATVLMLPVLIGRLAPAARIPAALLFLLGYCSLSGMIHFQPWNPRYAAVLLAGYALLWGGTRVFRRGGWRWLLAGVVTLNLCALLGVAALNIYWAETNPKRPGDDYAYLSDEDRSTISRELAGRPLLVIKDESLEALLVGPQVSFGLSYLTCPGGGDWEAYLRKAALTSNWLAVIHNGQPSIQSGPDFKRPGFPACSAVSTQGLTDALDRSGWRLYRHNRIIDIWRYQ